MPLNFSQFFHSMIFQLNSRLIMLLGISILIHAFVFLFTFSKVPSTAVTNNGALTVDLMQLTQNAATTTLSATASDSLLKGVIEEQVTNEKVAKMAVDSVQPSSNAEANDHLTTLPLTLPDTIYYGFDELDQMPTVLENIDGNSPELVDYPQGGTLKIQLLVDEFGYVIGAEVIESELPAQFATVAAQAFLQVKFTPGLKNNVPVRSMAKIVVHYAPLNKPV